MISVRRCKEKCENMWRSIRKIINIVLIIWTIPVLFVVYRNIEFPYVFEFVLSYVLFLLLIFLYYIITIFLLIRKSKWSTTRKILLNFIIGFFSIWALNVLLIYLTKGELRIMDKIFSSALFSFFLSFSELIFEKKSND